MTHHFPLFTFPHPAHVLLRLFPQVFYSFAPGSEEERMFSIDSTTGKISTRVRFDREDQSRDSPFYTIVVIAKDGAPSDIRQTSEPNQGRQPDLGAEPG